MADRSIPELGRNEIDRRLDTIESKFEVKILSRVNLAAEPGDWLHLIATMTSASFISAVHPGT